MARAAVLLVAIGLLAGAAHAGATPARRQVVLALLRSPSFGIVGVYDSVGCGRSCTTGTTRLLVDEHGRWREITPPGWLPELEDVVFASPRVGWVVGQDCAAGKAAVYRTHDG